MIFAPLITGLTVQNCSTIEHKYNDEYCCSNPSKQIELAEGKTVHCVDIKTSYPNAHCCDAPDTTPFTIPYPQAGYNYNFQGVLQDNNWPFGSLMQDAFEFPTHTLIAKADEAGATASWTTNNWAVDERGSFINTVKAEDAQGRTSSKDFAWNIMGNYVSGDVTRNVERYALHEINKCLTWQHGAVWTLNELSAGDVLVPTRGGDWFDGGTLLQLTAHHFPPDAPFALNALGAIMHKISLADNMLASPHVSEHGKFHAKLKRAHLYFVAADMFGHIHFFDDVSKGPQEWTRVKMTRSELFASAEATLLSAIGKPDGLTDCTICSLTPNAHLLDTKDEKYDFTVGSVLALLAQMYLNAGVLTGTPRWEDAHNAANLLLHKNMYKLSDDTVVQPNYGRRNPAVWNDSTTVSGYDAVFSSHNGDNPEIIMHLAQGWSDVPDGEKASSFDWFAQAPYQAWVNANNGGVNIMAMSAHYYYPNAWGTDRNWCGAGCNGYMVHPDFARKFESNDPRLNNFHRGVQYLFDGTPAFDSASKPYPEVGVPRVPSVVNYTMELNEIWPNGHRLAGWRLAKPRPTSTTFGSNMDYKTVVFRLAEAYFIRAEAKARIENDWSNAQTLADVNAVRARSGMTPYTSLDEDEFLDEKAREMFMEMRRRQDLIRFDKFRNPTAYKNFQSLESAHIFPIPQVFVDDLGWDQNHADYLTMQSQFPPPGWSFPPPAPPAPPPSASVEIPVFDDAQWNSLSEEQKQTMADAGFDRHLLGKVTWNEDGGPGNKWRELAVEPFKSHVLAQKEGDVVDVYGFAHMIFGGCTDSPCAFATTTYDNMMSWAFTVKPKVEWPEWTSLSAENRTFLTSYGYDASEIGMWYWNSGPTIAQHNVDSLTDSMRTVAQFMVATPLEVFTLMQIVIKAAQAQAAATGQEYVDPIVTWRQFALEEVGTNADTRFGEVNIQDTNIIYA